MARARLVRVAISAILLLGSAEPPLADVADPRGAMARASDHAGGVAAIVGIPAAPVVERNGDAVELVAPGVHLRFASAEVQKTGDTVRVAVRR